MKKFRPMFLGVIALTLCGCTLSPAHPENQSKQTSTPPQYNLFGAPTDQASKVPVDIPLYPGGIVISVSGDDSRISVAQDTPHTSSVVIAWVTDFYKQQQAALVSKEVSTRSTELRFVSGAKKYSVRVDQPVEGGAFLTISKENK